MSGRSMPLNYIRESLGHDEKVVHVARFHWFYDALAWFWLCVGFFGAFSIIGAGCAYVVNVDIERAFPDLDPAMRGMAIDKIVGHYGGWVGLIRELHIATKIGAALVLLWGVLSFVSMMVVKYTTEIAVTTKRLVYKRGVVARFIGEIKLDRIEGVNVWQSFFGRIFNYGRLMVRGVGTGEVILPNIEDPLKFRKAIDFAKSKLLEPVAVREIDRPENTVDNQG